MFEIDLNKFEQLELIGEGAYGLVYQIREKETGEIFAAKVFRFAFDFEDDKTLLLLEREINTMSMTNHPAILRFYGISKKNFNGELEPVIIMEYAKNQSLYFQLDLQRRSLSAYFTDTHKLISIYGIASAMKYLHSHNIIHRDLKPDNILLDDAFYPKISDFGLSKETTPEAIQSNVGLKGTLSYMAPEIFTEYNYSNACDVYSFSIVVYEIITTEIPYRGLTDYQIQRNVGVLNIRPEFPIAPIPAAYRNLIERCWSQNPADRPSFEDIVDELENNPEFITEQIDEDEYFRYVDFIKESKTSFDHSKRFEPEKRIDQLQQLAAQGDLQSMYRLATLMYKGENIDLNKQEALRLFKMAAEKGEVNSMYQYANMLLTGDGVEKNEKEAFRLFKLAAEKGQVDAMNSYANMLDCGIAVDTNKEEACRYFKMAADKGHLSAMNSYAFMLFNGLGIEQNQQEACRYFKMASDNGDLEGMFNYANILDSGQGTEMNQKEAAKIYKKAADKGQIEAMNNYGIALRNGYAGETNLQEALKYFKMAADKGQINAMYNYAELVGTVHPGITMDKTEACKYYKMAADKGLSKAMLSYGLMLLNGEGVKINQKEAVKYFKMAAAKGSIDSCYQIGLSFEQGKGVKMNKNVACHYYKMAADRGHPQAIGQYKTLIQNGCTPSDVESRNCIIS